MLLSYTQPPSNTIIDNTILSFPVQNAKYNFRYAQRDEEHEIMKIIELLMKLDDIEWRSSPVDPISN